jgi:hypothetical protein
MPNDAGHHRRNGLLAAGLVLVLAGCATSPVGGSEATPVPAGRLLAPTLTQAKPDSVALTVKRDRGMMGGACNVRVFVDGTAIADLSTAEKVVVYVPYGDHIVSAQPRGVCAGGMSEVQAVAKPGARLNFRVGYGSNGDFALNPTAF